MQGQLQGLSPIHPHYKPHNEHGLNIVYPTVKSKSHLADNIDQFPDISLKK